MNERELIERLSDYLKETHEACMQAEWPGNSLEYAMSKHEKEEPDCTYCKAIADAGAMLNTPKP